MILKRYNAKSRLLIKSQIGLVILFTILCIHPAISQVQEKQPVQDSTADKKVHLFVEEMPVFPGNLNAWIYNNIHYP